MIRLLAVVLLGLAAPFAGAAEALLADAAEHRDSTRLRELLEQSPPLEDEQADGMTALLWAVHHDDEAAVQLLLDAGARVDHANRYDVLPLSLACQNGNPSLVTALLKAGADPETTLAEGETALMTAARTGSAPCVNLLLAQGAKVNAKESHGQTALMWAAAEGHADVVEALLKSGAEFREPLSSGFTPLLFAVRAGHLDVVRSLLAAGADVTEPVQLDRRRGKGLRPGSGPLLLAVENGHFELALELVKAGADPNDQRAGFTALHALTWVRKTGLGDDEAGDPPPAGSGSVGSLEFVPQLVALGADVNVRRKRGSGGRGKMHSGGATPFLLAAKSADLPLLKTLVACGADPDIPNVDDCTPLLAAAGMGTHAPGEEAGTEDEALETVAYLLELGADLNHIDKNGETTMHGAAYGSFSRLVRFLDEHGADLAIWNRKNKWGWTPLVIAQGFRPGNFKPHDETIAAFSEVMRAKGVEPPPPPPRQKKAWEE